MDQWSEGPKIQSSSYFYVPWTDGEINDDNLDMDLGHDIDHSGSGPWFRWSMVHLYDDAQQNVSSPGTQI